MSASLPSRYGSIGCWRARTRFTCHRHRTVRGPDHPRCGDPGVPAGGQGVVSGACSAVDPGDGGQQHPGLQTELVDLVAFSHSIARPTVTVSYRPSRDSTTISVAPGYAGWPRSLLADDPREGPGLSVAGHRLSRRPALRGHDRTPPEGGNRVAVTGSWAASVEQRVREPVVAGTVVPGEAKRQPVVRYGLDGDVTAGWAGGDRGGIAGAAIRTDRRPARPRRQLWAFRACPWVARRHARASERCPARVRALRRPSVRATAVEAGRAPPVRR